MSSLRGRVSRGGGIIGLAAFGPVPNLSYSFVWHIVQVKEFGVLDCFWLGEIRREVLDNEVCCLLKGFLVQVPALGTSLVGFGSSAPPASPFLLLARGMSSLGGRVSKAEALSELLLLDLFLTFPTPLFGT